MKTPNMAYYHYTIDENNISQASAYFRQFGRLAIKFEKHPRAVPPGQRRFIVEVEQKE